MKYVMAALLAVGGLSLAAGGRGHGAEGRPAIIADSVKTDPETGLAVDASLPLIKAHCTACHSSKLILQNKFTREGWLGKIRWMQKNHKLWDLGPSEPTVLDYLVKYYGPVKQPFDGRRRPLEKVEWYKLTRK